jgi:hypothetical protein
MRTYWKLREHFENILGTLGFFLVKNLMPKQSQSKAQKTVTTTTKPQKQSKASPLSLSLSLYLVCLLACLIVATLPLSWWIALHPLSPTKLLQDPEETIASS